MTYKLFIGDYAYSSWSLRGWLLFERFGIECTAIEVDFSKTSVADQLGDAFPAKTVPTVVCDADTVIWDSLSLAEELHSRHPDAGLWPDDPRARATARSLAAEMHSGFSALRNECPMNMNTAYTGVKPSDDVQKDIDRLRTLWAYARGMSQNGGPWLFGNYCAADAFFAPIAARLAGYGFGVGEEAQAYVSAHLNDPVFRAWRRRGLAQNRILPWYKKPYQEAPWPVDESNHT